MAETKKTVATEATVKKADAVLAQQETAKVSFADKRLAKAQEQAAEGKFFRAGFNRLIGNVAKHPVATAVGIGLLGAAGGVGYAIGAASGNTDDNVEATQEELGDVEIVNDEPVE